MKVAAEILEAFHHAAGEYLAAPVLARRLKLAPEMIPGEIAALRQLGYTFESHPHLGYRLLATPDRLTADDITARLENFAPRRNGRVIGSQILVFEQTASTNDIVEQMAPTFAGEGLVVFAETQTKGRGRHGRAWVSPRGKGLWFSVLLRPPLAPVEVGRITVAASVAVALTLRKAARMDARIKWPNDVTVGGKKIAGVLTELRANADDAPCAILGIGLNVNCAPEDFPTAVASIATSLQIATGQAHDRIDLAAQLLGALDEWYRIALADFSKVSDEWARLSTTLGKQVVVTIGPRRVEGHAAGLHEDGALLVRKDSGQVERILGGDLIVES